jgi:hypothetical protein
VLDVLRQLAVQELAGVFALGADHAPIGEAAGAGGRDSGKGRVGLAGDMPSLSSAPYGKTVRRVGEVVVAAGAAAAG